MSALLKKPRKWAFNPGLVAPEWEWFWEGCIGAWPFWESAGNKVLDISSFNQAGTFVNTPTWGADARGPTVDFQAASSDHIDVGTAGHLSLPGVMSVLCVHHMNDNYTSSQSLVGWANSSASLNYDLEFGRTNNKYSWLNNSTAITLDSTRSISDNNIHVICVTRGGGTGDWDISMFIDGVLDGATTTVENPNDAAGSRLGIAKLGNFGTFKYEGSISLMVLWDKTLTDDQAIKITRDPFGPFRMGEDVALFAPLALVTISDYRFRQRFFG